MRSQTGGGAAATKALAACGESEGREKKRKEKGKRSENCVFILAGCEAPPSPVMVGAPHKKCLLPFNDGEHAGQRAAREAQKGDSGDIEGGWGGSPPSLLRLLLLRNGRALAQRCIR